MNAGEGAFFGPELSRRFPGVPPERLSTLFRVYDSLPRAIFLGGLPAEGGLAAEGEGAGSHLQCCHGGLEVGFNPRPFLSVPTAGQQALNSSGAVVSHALIHGYRRKAWLQRTRGFGGRAASLVPPKLRHRFEDSGSEPWWAEGWATAQVAADGSLPLPSSSVPPPSSLRGAWAGRKSAAAWPLDPLDISPPDGFLWNDVLVDDESTPLHYANSRGFVVGRPLMAAWLADAGIAGLLRAHQHNNAHFAGPMLDRIRAGRGLYNNWRNSSMVLTWLSGAHIPGMDMGDDVYGLLTLGGHRPEEWTLRQCIHAAGRPHEWSASGWVEGNAPPPEWAAMAAAGKQATCALGGAFTCIETGWRPGLAATIAAGGAARAGPDDAAAGA
jgi:hypothetical protein